MTQLDPRITPFREDVAAEELKGQVQARRFAVGKPQTVVRGRMALREKPASDSRQETELLFGDLFTVYDTSNGWAWGQVEADKYVGYAHTIACTPNVITPDHRVTALATPLLPGPDPRRSAIDVLPLNAKVKVISRANGFVRVAPDGFVFAGHIAPLASRVDDYVSVAERFLGTPYVWGGKTHSGIDCSGLVQTSLEAGGMLAPRDSDMQENALGKPLAIGADLSGLKRGDLVFWKGHVGIMLDPLRLLHAAIFHMEVKTELLADAVARITQISGPITSVKRL
jgi:hypothetical protein